MPGLTSKEGFTLMEVLVSLTIVTIGVIGVMSLFGGSLRSITKSSEVGELGIIATTEMQKILLEPSLEETSASDSIGDYLVSYEIKDITDERFEALPISLYEIDLRVEKDGKVFHLKTEKLIKTTTK
ncbi:MAG: prepilin-type N-terminal cleavage/methylation domain-containing protein [Nitrospirae bacterium]|nr:MAG: prepilin-type N-terminal cleavage/methylation domain-containing protein [Nitrospirota bacterium]